MTNDCGELLKGRSEASLLETAVPHFSLASVSLSAYSSPSAQWLHCTIRGKNWRCESSAKIMIAMGSDSIQAGPGAALESQLNERSYSVKF